MISEMELSVKWLNTSDANRADHWNASLNWPNLCHVCHSVMFCCWSAEQHGAVCDWRADLLLSVGSRLLDTVFASRLSFVELCETEWNG